MANLARQRGSERAVIDELIIELLANTGLRASELCDPVFRRAVRQVLEYLGEEPIFGNFIKYDGLIDWKVFAENINRPKRLALCHVLDGQGQKVTVEGTPVVVAREIVACSKSEAAQILAKESKVLVKWW